MNIQLKLNPSFNLSKLIPGYRKQIDDIDEQIINLLEKRNKLSNKIGECKKSLNEEVTDNNREYEILIRLSDKKKNIYNSELIKIYREIFVMSKRIQKNSKKFTL